MAFGSAVTGAISHRHVHKNIVGLANFLRLFIGLRPSSRMQLGWQRQERRLIRKESTAFWCSFVNCRRHISSAKRKSVLSYLVSTRFKLVCAVVKKYQTLSCVMFLGALYAVC